MTLPQTLENAEYSFFVPGVPKPQGSKKGLINRHTGKVALIESGGQAHQDWRSIVAFAGMKAMDNHPPLKGACVVRLTFRFPVPTSWTKKRRERERWPITRSTGDLDKLERAVFDALTHICWMDDSQIIEVNSSKKWADEHRPVGCAVQIWGYTWEEKL